jgi:glycosyltransferase involved in cell wall biosynthesis
MEKLLVEFARHADRGAYELRFVSLTSRGPVADELESLGWPVHAMQEPDGLRPGLVLRLARLFRAWGADVVHAHNTKPLMYCGPAARLARVPAVVYTRHGQRHQSTRRQDLLFRAAARTADRLVCVSHDSAALCGKDGLPAARITTIWNGIDTSKFAYSGPCPDGPAVMVGRLSPEKDVQTLVRAAAIVRAARPGFRLHVAGDGACMPDLKAVAASLGVSDVVTFLGEVRDVPALLAGASLFVLSSLTEGISLTLLEAMARGLPVVATRVGGNPEVVADGETGLLVPAASPADLADAMIRLHDEPETARAMGLAGRARVERHFNVQNMVARYESIYRELTGPQVAEAARPVERMAYAPDPV